MLAIAVAADIVSVFFVPPDKEYITYFDFKTLTCLFCVLAVVTALRNIKFFTFVARKIVSFFRTCRSCVLALVYITFIGSMLIANDMALLTFLPLGYFVLKSTGKEKYMAFTFIMQNIAANLGGMLTPFGNPQNLYLYSYFNIPDAEFVRIMFPPFFLSVTLITICCVLFVKNEAAELKDNERIILNGKKTAIYLLLFVLSIVIVFRAIPYWIGLITVPAVLFFMDRSALKKVDYPLLLTFVAFFIFSGNVSRIEAVHALITPLMERSTLFFSVISCQFISNVPSAILLSRFTQNYAQLLVGVNIGGTGTLIASLASLITYREYTKNYPEKKKSYFLMFSAFNFSFLAVLTVFEMLLFR